MLAQFLFLLILIAAIVLFTINVQKIIRNINLGRPINRSDHALDRFIILLKVAFGQKKMVKKPIAAILHLFVYLGFIIINLEVLEIIMDGLLGTHRTFAQPLAPIYSLLINSFEILAVLVLIGVITFYIRRNYIKLKRFSSVELTAWPRTDANLILIIETLLMCAFLIMNAADCRLQQLEVAHDGAIGPFLISGMLGSLLPPSASTLLFLERFCWWFHIIGIFAFLNYLPYSKHFHIIMAFPNTYYSNLQPHGTFSNMSAVTNEVKSILDPSYTAQVLETSPFGAKDVTDLTWKSLMDAYTCTECGRCTASCPANITGKRLSPRKIMMDTRNRLDEVGKHIDQYGKDHQDGKSLLGDYISREEIWACTTCNACTEACPINIDPLAIIMELRRFMVMEEGNVSVSFSNMFSNIENNGAPWKYAPADRLNWAKST